MKPGEGVEVHYKVVGGVLTATEVHSGLPPTEGRAGRVNGRERAGHGFGDRPRR